MLTALSAASLVLAACGGGGSGTAPGGYPTYPDTGSFVDGTSGESSIDRSYHGEARVSSGNSVEEMLLGFTYGNTSTSTGLFGVSEFYNYYNSIPQDCSKWAFFKPTCNSTFMGTLASYNCTDSYWGVGDCGSYKNDDFALWFESKTNGKLRIRLQFEGSWDAQGMIAMLTFDDVDPNDRDMVQSINGGAGLKITLRGVTWSASFNKIIVIELEDVTGMDNDNDTVDADIYYGTSSSLKLIGSPRIEKLPLL